MQVAAIDQHTGQRTWREVYLFGHREHDTTSAFVNLVTAGPDAATLQLSPTHYVAVCVSGCSTATPVMRYTYARDVVVGDHVRVASLHGTMGARISRVAKVSVTYERGLFNPYIKVS
jgi:hypothetical protein